MKRVTTRSRIRSKIVLLLTVNKSHCFRRHYNTYGPVDTWTEYAAATVNAF